MADDFRVRLVPPETDLWEFSIPKFASERAIRNTPRHSLGLAFSWDLMSPLFALIRAMHPEVQAQRYVAGYLSPFPLQRFPP
jgi:hypothetical protein